MVEYQGLIATKGQPEIGTKQYLGTEYDFGDAAAITCGLGPGSGSDGI